MTLFCPHVYNALEINTSGQFKPCCISSKRYKDADGKIFNADEHSVEQVYNSKDRQKFIKHFEHFFKTDCKQCWEVEQGGGESKRLREIAYWKNYYIHKQQDMPIMDNQTPLELLDLKLGNTCNLACSTCAPDSSSKWNSIYKQQTGEWGYEVQKWQDTDEFWDSLIKNVHQVKKIELAGGEPFMNKKQKLLLNYLVENDLAKNIDITWITNSTHYEQDIVDMFEHFDQVRIMVSLDNTHEQFEYMRYPAKWDESYEIFKKFCELKEKGMIELGISHTISALNIYHLPEMHQFARQHRVNLFNNLVMWPWHCKELPEDFKQTVKQKLEACTDPSYQTNPAVGPNNWLVEFMMQPSSQDQNWMKRHLDFVNVSRPGMFERAFPELQGIFE